MALLSEQAWLLRRHPKYGDLNTILPILDEYARRHDAKARMLQHRIQSYEQWVLLKKTEGAEPERLLREIESLLSGLTSYDIWDVFLLFEEVFTDLSSESQRFFHERIRDDEGPFWRARFGWSDSDIQSDLEHLLETPSDTLNAAVRRVCHAWPYKVLGIKPPYSKGAYGSSASMA